MPVVLDTNVLARATLGGTGPASQVLELLLTEPHVLVASEFLLSALSRVLRYPRVQQMHGLDDVAVDAFIASVISASLIVDIPEDAPFVSTDKDDNPVIATAIEGRADVLCTWDRHFFNPMDVQYLSQFGIRVLNDPQLLAELRP